MKTRKRRSDRNHVIYKITCLPTQEEYIGVTVQQKAALKRTLKTRLQQHEYKATVVGPEWNLSSRIREHGIEFFLIEPIAIVRGRLNAFRKESLLINKHKPSLNTKRQNSNI